MWTIIESAAVELRIGGGTELSRCLFGVCELPTLFYFDTSIAPSLPYLTLPNLG